MTRLGKEYDVIVVGAGINGVAAAAYLQKAGLNVAVFERRHEAGTHCCTEETMHPGVRVSVCANQMMTLSSPAYEELELERFGLELLTSSEWCDFHAVNRTKKAVFRHQYDARKQYEAWKSISEKDAEMYRKQVNYLAPYFQELLELLVYSPITIDRFIRVAGIISKIPGMPPGWLGLSGHQLVQEWYKDESIRAGCYASAYTAGVLGLEQKGLPVPLYSTLLNPSWIAGFTARGGPHNLAHALTRCFCHYGGSYFPNCPVEKIIIENREAKGVVLSKSAVYPEAEIRATKAVVSNLSCHPTFIDLVGLDKLPSWAVKGVKAYDYDSTILFDSHFALKEPLDWKGFPPECNTTMTFFCGLEGEDDMMRARADLFDAQPHRAPDPPIICGFSMTPTLADPTQAPPGQHTLMTWSCVPYDLDKPGGALAWDDIREEYGQKVEDLLNEYAPNLKKAKIARYDHTPLDYYRRNPSCRMGSSVSGSVLQKLRLSCNVPFPDCNAPRSPIGKLYLSNCGLSTTQLQDGYIAADAVARDLGVREQDWWVVKPMEPGVRWLKRRGITPRWSVD